MEQNDISDLLGAPTLMSLPERPIGVVMGMSRTEFWPRFELRPELLNLVLGSAIHTQRESVAT